MGLELGPLSRQVRSQSVYRLRYPSSYRDIYQIQIAIHGFFLKQESFSSFSPFYLTKFVLLFLIHYTRLLSYLFRVSINYLPIF
jgi:hypothetical protein